MEDTNIKDIFVYFTGKAWVIILIMLIGLIFGGIFNIYLKTPLYKSSSTLVLTRVYDDNSEITTGDVQLNKQLVASYREIVKSKRILSQVIDDLNLKYSYEELSEMIAVETVKDTELIEISVESEKNTQAEEIATKVVDVFCEEIVELYNVQNVKIVDGAEVSKEPYNMSMTKDVLIFGVGGFALACAILLMVFYFDTKIKNVTEIETKVGLPVIGAIPVLTEKEFKGAKK